MHNANNRTRLYAIERDTWITKMTMQTLSARLPMEDMEWLVGLEIEGAISPSDKLRALVAQMRRQHEGTLDYQRSLSWLQDLIAPFVSSIRALEHHNRMHSELLALAIEWSPQVMAALLSERTLDKDAKRRAVEIEEVVAQRSLQFLASVLRLAVTREASGYSPNAIERHLPTVLEIAEIVAQTRKMREEAK
jgi:hypothetical protein